MAYRRKFFRSFRHYEIMAETRRHFPYRIGKDDIRIIVDKQPSFHHFASVGRDEIDRRCEERFGPASPIMTKWKRKVPPKTPHTELSIDLNANYVFDWEEGFFFKKEADAVMFKLLFV